MHLASLCKDVHARSDEVRGVKARFELGGDKATLRCQRVSLLYGLHRIFLKIKNKQYIKNE